MTTPRELAATYNDCLHVANSLLFEMEKEGCLTARWRAQLVAQLNATLYTLGYALPPGTIEVQLDETKDTIRVTEKAVAPPKRKG